MRLWGAWLGFRIAGVRVAFNNLFVALLVLMAAVGLLPAAALMFAVVLAHEIGHAYAAHRLGVRVECVELLPFGGVARLDELLQLKPSAEVAVALAGPAVNAALIGVALLAGGLGWLPEPWLTRFIEANAAIAVFNLTPAFPMDGGRVLRALLARRIGLKGATLAAVRLGRVIGLLFVFAAVALWLWERPYPALAVVGLFVFVAAGKEQGKTLYVILRYLAAKEREIDGNGYVEATTLVAQGSATLRTLLHRVAPQQYLCVSILDAEGKIVTTVTEQQIVELLFERGLDATIGTLLSKP